MTDRVSRTRLDFTRDQVLDALRTAGWPIPDPATDTTIAELKAKVDGAKVIIEWDKQETGIAPTP